MGQQRYGTDMREVHRELMHLELDELKDYLSTIEGELAGRLDEFQNALDARTASMSKERKEGFIDWVADDAIKLIDRFPSMVQRTAFVFLYSLFEHALINVCETVRSYGKFQEPVTGKDKGITAAQKFLKDVAMVSFPDQSREWNEIKRMAEIRNFYSHRGGKVKGEPTRDLLDFIRQKGEMIELVGLNEVKLNAGFCQDAIETIRRFFDLTLDAIPDKFLRN